jgi:hypothetical protein
MNEVIKLRPMNILRMKLAIRGVTPLIQHKWTEKALGLLREKHAGKKTKTREVRDPQQEAQDAMYVTDDGQPGLPLLAIKSALINAAHKDIGIEKTLVRKALFITGGGVNLVLPMKCVPHIVREDYVRVSTGGPDLRYRPQFDQWEVDLQIDYDADLLQPADIVNLLARAGFGVGLCEWRPEKGGDYGRFEVVTV